MKTTVRSREIWMKIARNQKIRTCCNQAACNFLQNREHSDHSNKNRQNWACSILESNMSVKCRIFCLSMWMSKRNYSTCNSTLFLLCWNKISDSRLMYESNECQKSHQQFRKNAQIDQMIHSAADSAAVQFDWEIII